MLFSKQEALMEELQREKDKHKKFKGLEMDDIDIATTLKRIQQEMLGDGEVVDFYTRMIHLELRVKNVAVMKLQKIQQKKEKASACAGLNSLIKKIMKDKGKSATLQRSVTQNLEADGLVDRLTDQVIET